MPHSCGRVARVRTKGLRSPDLTCVSCEKRLFLQCTTSVQLKFANLCSGGQKWPNATNYGLVVEYMDRAQGATRGFLPKNLRGTHTSAAESSGRRYVAASLLRDGHAAWHLTSFLTPLRTDNLATTESEPF